MYKRIKKGSNALGFLKKITAFFAAFLLLLQPLSVVFAEENISSDVAVEESTQSDSELSQNLSETTQEIKSPDVIGEIQSDEQVNSEPVDQAEGEGVGLATGVGTTEYGDHYRNQTKVDKFAHTDGSTGNLNFSLPIEVPPGRNNMQPDLSLTYNSNDSNKASIVGYGWSLSIPYIQTLNKKGFNSMYGDGYYYSSLDGELVQSPTDSSTYYPKVDQGDFRVYQFLDTNMDGEKDTWSMTTKDGTVYKFGYDSYSRQDNNENGDVFKWFLSEERDTNDNFLRYEYFEDTIYNQVYPDKIFYTGNGVTDGIYEIDFSRVTSDDPITDASAGFLSTFRYRISEITIKTNGDWTKKYDFAYSNPDNRVKSLLASITESGKDSVGTVTTLDPYTFTYQGSSASGWTLDPSWELPEPFVDNTETKNGGTYFTELNGDGLPDLIRSYKLTATGTDIKRVYLNDGTGWVLQTGTDWALPTGPHFFEEGDDMGYRIADVNGDGLDDIIRSYNTTVGAWINNGHGWDDDSDWYPPVMFNGLGGYDNGVRLLDMNGDGLLDLLFANKDFLYSKTYINNGNGWTDTDWGHPSFDFVEFASHRDYGIFPIDLNGDGVSDFMQVTDNEETTRKQWLTKGDGNWIESDIMSGLGTGAEPNPRWFIQDYTDLGYRFMDFNSDSRSDIITSVIEGGIVTADTFLNSGYSWFNIGDTDTGWLSPESFILKSGWKDADTRFVDYNADGMVDIVRRDASGDSFIYKNQSKKVDLLTGVTYPTGAITTVEYKPSTKYTDISGNMLNKIPFVTFTVSKITNNPGVGSSLENNYTYANGSYYYNSSDVFDKKFAGFGIVTDTDAGGNVTKTYYHQGNTTDTANGEYSDSEQKIGLPYRIEEYDNAGHLYRLTVNKWDKYNIGTNHDFVKLVRSTVLNYDGDADHKDTVTEYTYDNSNGNILTKTNWGEVSASTDGSFTDTGSDKSTETYTYASNVGANIIGLPSQITTTDQSGNKVNETKYFYDNQTFGNVTDGNPTKEQKWIVGTTYQTWKKSYNTNGTIASETDPRNKVTTYTSYDSFGLYPLTISNPLSQSTSYAYDYSSGKISEKTDPNGSKIENIFDGLDRVIEEKISDPTSGSQVTKTTYSYDDTSFPNSITQNNYLDATTARTSISYKDGFGRTVQNRTEMEDSGDYSIKDTVYNNVGLVEKESLPYTDTGSSYESPTGTSSLYTSYTYDALDRPLTISNNLGTTTNSYDQWTTTTTDPTGKVKDYINDARGNLTSVIEHDGGSSYTTSYEWNLNGLLTKITDSLSNIRNFTYDGIGNRLSAEDLHAVGDTTFGTWNYSYDASGNMTQSISPKGDTVSYTYDDINRVLTENWTGGTGTEITYTYDSCTEGIGYLCSANVLGGVATNYTYTQNGLVKSDTRTIGGTGYTTNRIYDRNSNITQIQLPDSSQIRYSYNSAGLKETVQRKESGGSWTNVLTDIDYAPTDQVKYLAYQNGVTTTNTFDSTKLYRLTSKVTAKTGGSTFQSIAYTYDAVGNITNLVDSGTTGGAKTFAMTYDNLHRLTYINATSLGTGSAYNQTFTYNSIGNLTSVTGTGGTTYSTTQYNGSAGSSYANPHAATKIGGVNRVYDQNGNMLGNGSLTNTWNYKNELTQTVTGGNTISYTYDHNGDRMTYTNPTGTTVTPSKEYEITGTLKKKYIYLDDELVATIEDNAGTITPHFVHTDHLFGSSVITNNSGTQDEVVDYYPFGEGRVDTLVGSFKERHKYTGHIRDEDTGLEYAKARYLNTKYNRFVSQDKVFQSLGDNQRTKELSARDLQLILQDPQSLNSYAYARNNPFKYVDYDGNWYSEFLTGHQSFSSFVGEVGNAATYLGPTWQSAMNHPVAAGTIVGASAGVAAWGVSAGATALSVELLGGAGTACITSCDKGKTVAQNGINITEKGLKHVIDRHTLNGNLNTGASIFNKGEDIVQLIKSASNQNAVLQKGGNLQRIYDTGRNIGIDRATGQPTSVVTVITNKANELITSFPGSPSIKNLIK